MMGSRTTDGVRDREGLPYRRRRGRGRREGSGRFSTHFRTLLQTRMAACAQVRVPAEKRNRTADGPGSPHGPSYPAFLWAHPSF
jgi:hypothetical protein